MLIKVDSNANNNKFYEVTLEGSCVTKRWGRVGASGTSSMEQTGETGYARVISAKKKKGYQEVSTADASPDGSSRNLKLMKIAEESLVSKKSSDDAKIKSLISSLVSQNKHQIGEISGGMIEVDDSGVMKTALGIITPSSISQARAILEQIQALKGGEENPNYVPLLEKYLSLVPQKVGHRSGWHKGFFKGNRMQDQFAFLDQLNSSYDWYEKSLENAQKQESGEVSYEGIFKYKLDNLQDQQIFDHINELFVGSKNTKHPTARHSLKNVYLLENPEQQERFSKASEKLQNVQELWHGTQVSNVLSILSKGLFIPPRTGSGIQIAGRMFGDGIYFSNQSTKSLNYSYGMWRGTRSDKCFMLLADVALGKTYHPKTYGPQTEARKTHNSIYVEPGTAGVLNNEVIVWDTDQIALKYLCEFSV